MGLQKAPSSALQQRVQRLCNPPHWGYLHTSNRFFGSVGGRHYGALKTVFSRLAKTLLTIRHRTNFAGQTNLAKHHQIARQRLIAKARYDRQDQCQIGAGLDHFNATHDVDEHILIADHNAAVAVQNCQQHRQPILIEADGHAPWITQMAIVY